MEERQKKLFIAMTYDECIFELESTYVVII